MKWPIKSRRSDSEEALKEAITRAAGGQATAYRWVPWFASSPFLGRRFPGAAGIVGSCSRCPFPCPPRADTIGRFQNQAAPPICGYRTSQSVMTGA